MQAEWVEIGDQMAAGAIGADEIHRAQGIQGRLLRVLGQGRCGRRVAVDRRAIAIRYGGAMTVDDLQRNRTSPARAGHIFFDACRLVMELGEERLPALVDAGRVFEIARVKLGDVIGVMAGQKAAGFEVLDI